MEKRCVLSKTAIQNGHGTQDRRKTLPKRLPEAALLVTNLFLVNFCVPAEPGWVLHWPSGRSRDAPKSACIFAASLKPSSELVGRSPESPQASPGTLWGHFLNDFWLIFGITFETYLRSGVCVCPWVSSGNCALLYSTIHHYTLLYTY